jgi:hypothetical protein
MDIIEHRPGDDLSDVLSFRYGVYLDELGWESPEADHDRRELGDELDRYAVVHSLVERGQIVGTLRTVCVADLPSLDPVASKGVRDGVERFGADAVVTTSRFMLSAHLRGGTSVLRLIKACQQYLSQRGVRLNYGDCSPQLLPFYEHMGYRRFAPAFNDPGYGWKFPILMVVADKERMTEVRSPLRSLIPDADDDREARQWFAEKYPEALEERSARLAGIAEFTEQIIATVGELKDADIIGELDGEQLATVLRSGTIVDAEPGARIIREGERGTTLFFVLSGVLDVVAGGEVIATLGAGEIVGEAALLAEGIRSASIDVTARTQLLVLDGEALLRLMKKNHALQATLGDALARLAAGRKTRPG